jgi:hypothetical protein
MGKPHRTSNPPPPLVPAWPNTAHGLNNEQFSDFLSGHVTAAHFLQLDVNYFSRWFDVNTR